MTSHHVKPPPLSSLGATLVVGERCWSRLDRGGGERPEGIVDEVARYAPGGQAVSGVAPEVGDFFERTSSLVLEVEPGWAAWVVAFVWLWHGVAWVIGQLCLPVVRSTIETTLCALPADLPGRVGSRGLWRCYAGRRKTMQVVVYSLLEHDGERHMSAVFPLPGAALEGVLRFETVTHDGDDGRVLAGARLTSHPRPGRAGDPVGVFLHTPLGCVRLPFDETLTLWAADAPHAPGALRAAAATRGDTLVGLHEQRLFGVVMGRHRYGFRPVPGRAIRPRT